MSRIAECMAALKAEGKRALIPYITAGDPNRDATVPLMHALVAAGADIVELGVPFSDPMADGPTIQLACERALEGGTRLTDVLDCVRQFRREDTTTPVVLMGYLNPIEAMGEAAFAAAAREAGVDGVLAVDLAVEEADTLVPALREHQLDPIFLVAPTTSEVRIAAMGNAGSGYLYYVSLKGVTGSAELDVNDVRERVKILRGQADLPVAVGFGVRDAATAAAIGAVADGVVVGSALVEQIAANLEDTQAACAAVGELLAAMRHALDA